MKKRVALFAVLVLSLVALFAFTVSAATQVTDDGTNLTLGNCTIDGLEGVEIPSPTRGLAYTLDDNTKTATVSGRGSFSGGDLVFPSTVKYGGNTYAVTKINSNLFQKLSYNIYVPDSITSIVGGSGIGTFGNSTITKVYIGSGLDKIEQETFSGSKGFEVFVCKSKPTNIGVYAFNQCSPSSNGMTAIELDLSNVIRFEELCFNGATILSQTSITFSPDLEFVGRWAFISSKANGSVVIPENCTLSNRCFNGTSFEQVMIKVPKDTVRQLPEELFSGADGGLTIIFNGAAEANANYVFSENSANVYMPSYKMIEALASTASKMEGNARLKSVTFYACDELKSYSSTSAGVLSQKGEGQHIYGSELIHFEANCSQYERDAYVCYVCGHENVVSQGTEYSEHVYETTTKAPNCQSSGYTTYTCTVCDYKETVHFTFGEQHSATVLSYEASGSTLTITKSCQFCNQVVSSEEISLVNKCYIDGYGLFDATMDYVSVDANGVVTPSNVTFDKAVIYFPSYVMLNGEIVEVKSIKGYTGYSIKGIYVPDTVSRIVGGSGTGCFGNISTLKNVVVGKGVTVLEQEVFSMGNGATVEEFIFKSTITSLGNYCMQKMYAKSSDIPYEFDTSLTYVGQKVNYGGNLLREARLQKGCNLSQGYAFNDANGLLSIFIKGGDSASDALDLGAEFASNIGTKYYYISGYVTTSGRAVISGLQGSVIYMESTDAIDVFASAIKSHDYRDRIDDCVFMDCQTQKAWFIDDDADRIEHPSASFSHGGSFVENESTCAQVGTKIETCFVCGATVLSEELEKKEHILDGGVITQMPTNEQGGEIVYSCLICGDSTMIEIAPLSQKHNCETNLEYANGFANSGLEIISCPDCEYTATREIMPIFTALGYSVSDDKTGITCCYRIDNEALEYYESIEGTTKIGFIVADASDVENNGIVDAEYNLKDGVNGLQVLMNDKGYSFVEVKLAGATTEVYRSYNFIFTAYIVSNDEISYVQCQEKSSLDVIVGDYTLKAININKAYQ